MRALPLTVALAALIGLPHDLTGQLPGLPVHGAWGIGPVVAVDIGGFVDTTEARSATVAVSAGYRWDWWEVTVTGGHFSAQGPGPTLTGAGVLAGHRYLQVGVGYAAGDGQQELQWVASIPVLIGPGGVSDKLAWGAGLGVRVMYVDVGGTSTSVDGWRAGATLIAQAELPNGWGGRLAIDATGPFNGEQLDYAVTLGLHYSFRSFVSYAKELRRERRPRGKTPERRAPS
jgi:hypothetical protein